MILSSREVIERKKEEVLITISRGEFPGSWIHETKLAYRCSMIVHTLQLMNDLAITFHLVCAVAYNIIPFERYHVNKISFSFDTDRVENY